MSSTLSSVRTHSELALQLPCKHRRPRNSPLRRVCAHAELSRRGLCSLAPAYGSLILAAPALAFEKVPAGYLLHRDILDGYQFFYPESWSAVTTSGNDVFYKNPRVADENVFVAISSPSSSKFTSVSDLGSPEDAAKRLEAQFLTEFMSTRIGVKREVSVLSAESRQGKDGKLFYDIAVRIQSYASRQQLAVTDTQRQDAIVQEFDRVLLTTLGTASLRLYEFRIQTPYKKYEKNRETYTTMDNSFQCKEVE